MATILVIEDNDTLRDGVNTILSEMGHEIICAEQGEQGLELFRLHRPDLIITDLKMDRVDGLGVLEKVIAADDDAVVMIMTAFGSIETAVNAMQHGAYDFIPKPFPPSLLRQKVERALESRQQRQKVERLTLENELLRQGMIADWDAEIIGDSSQMSRIFNIVKKVATSDSTIYIHGESGTGKELVARAIHRASHRANGPFIKVNCSALADSLLESELFGHEKGAFTGASKRRLGRFELADGGTLFLDEIGDISAAVQLKLLRVLQEREFERVGGEQTIKVDVRIVTATNKELMQEVSEGRFREDLFYRLHIIPLELPPLRDRREDIPILAGHFIDKLKSRTRSLVVGVADEAMTYLMRYDWPGNVRELENVIEHAMVFAENEFIECGDLPAMIRGSIPEIRDDFNIGAGALPDILDKLEKRLILQAYQQAEGVKTETARLLGIKPSALYYKLEKYGIEHCDKSTG